MCAQVHGTHIKGAMKQKAACFLIKHFKMHTWSIFKKLISAEYAHEHNFNLALLL
jgi:hypothetical protein